MIVFTIRIHILGVSMHKLLATILLTFSASVGIGAVASSADLPLKASVPVAALPSWSGIYVGVNAGGAYSDVDFFVPASPTNVAGNCLLFGVCPVDFGSHSASGGVVGGQVGINYQVGMWLVGTEMEAAWTNLKGGAASQVPLFAGAGLTGNSKVDGIFDASARAGFVAGRTLFFLKGGAAWARDAFSTATPVLTTTNVSDTRMGWIAGVGMEYEIHGSWTAKLEYDYLGFGTKLETLTGTGGPVDFNIKQNIQLVKGGLNYRFSGW
jgi:outer membrane immunogenic protein